jgi:hypothetical protein
MGGTATAHSIHSASKDTHTVARISVTTDSGIELGAITDADETIGDMDNIAAAKTIYLTLRTLTLQARALDGRDGRGHVIDPFT